VFFQKYLSNPIPIQENTRENTNTNTMISYDEERVRHQSLPATSRSSSSIATSRVEKQQMPRPARPEYTVQGWNGRFWTPSKFPNQVMGMTDRQVFLTQTIQTLNLRAPDLARIIHWFNIQMFVLRNTIWFLVKTKLYIIEQTHKHTQQIS